MKKVYSESEAMEFFLGNCSGNCICVKRGIEIEVNCFPDAVRFFRN